MSWVQAIIRASALLSSLLSITAAQAGEKIQLRSITLDVESQASAEHTQRTLSLIEKLADFAKPALELPETLGVTVYTALDDMKYERAIGGSIPRLHVSLHLTFDTLQGRTATYEAQAMGLIAHEFGHAIFAPVFEKCASTRLDQLYWTPYIMAYNELFADVFAVAYFQDPEIISKTIIPSGTPGNWIDRMAELRSFGREQRAPSDFLNRYTMLSKARSPIWKEILSQSNGPEDSARRVKRILDVFEAEACNPIPLELIRDSEEKASQLMSRRLIQNLKPAF